MKPSTPVREASCAAVWAPWLAAPLFALLPIGGCGLAGLTRPTSVGKPAARHATVAAHAAPDGAASWHAASGG